MGEQDEARAVPVIQADRDAAASCWPKDLSAIPNPTHLRSGIADGHYLVQAFARHRIAYANTAQGEEVAAECEQCHGEGKGVVPVEEPGDYLRDRLLNIAAICEAKGLLVEAAGLRDTANIVSEQFKKWIVQ